MLPGVFVCILPSPSYGHAFRSGMKMEARVLRLHLLLQVMPRNRSGGWESLILAKPATQSATHKQQLLSI